jgi:hypothetical protein
VWRLIVSPSAEKHAPWCVGDCALDGISRLTEGNKENKTVFRSPEPNRDFPSFVFLWFEAVLRFPHNLAPVSVLYIGERPEMTSHDEEPMKVRI